MHLFQHKRKRLLQRSGQVFLMLSVSITGNSAFQIIDALYCKCFFGQHSVTLPLFTVTLSPTLRPFILLSMFLTLPVSSITVIWSPTIFVIVPIVSISIPVIIPLTLSLCVYKKTFLSVRSLNVLSQYSHFTASDFISLEQYRQFFISASTVSIVPFVCLAVETSSFLLIS